MQWNTMFSQLAGGMLVSTQIFVVTLVFSLPLGLLISFGRMSKNRVIQGIVKAYISVMRGTPLMLQLMVVYFGPYYLFKIKIGNGYRLWAAFIGFIINYAAYFAEIYRSGIQSMPAGQYEAAKILGYSSSGDEADSAVNHERGDHSGQGYVTGVLDQRSRDVCDCKSTCIFTDKPDAVCGGWRFLLCI